MAAWNGKPRDQLAELVFLQFTYDRKRGFEIRSHKKFLVEPLKLHLDFRKIVLYIGLLVANDIFDDVAGRKIYLVRGQIN